MACTTLSTERGICNDSQKEYSIKKAMLKKSQANCLLADHPKFGKTSRMTFGRLDQLSTPITDQMPDQNFIQCCDEHQCEIALPL